VAVAREAGLPSPAVLRPWLRLQEALAAYVFLAPAALIFAAFIIFPVLFSFYLSLTRWNLLEPRKAFVGLENYLTLLRDPVFSRALLNTLYFAAGSIPLSMVLALAVALLLNQKVRGMAAYRVAYFSPMVTSTVAIAVVWMWIFDPYNGVANYALSLVGVPPLRWLFDPGWAMPALIIMRVWQTLGYNVVVYLAGLQNVPETYYEAARIDGASPWSLFRSITLPLLSPSTFFILVMSIISSFQVFAQIHVMTQGGPLQSTTVIVYYIYQHAFEGYRMGYSSAMAFVLFAVIFSLTLVQMKWVQRRVHYE